MYSKNHYKLNKKIFALMENLDFMLFRKMQKGHAKMPFVSLKFKLNTKSLVFHKVKYYILAFSKKKSVNFVSH